LLPPSSLWPNTPASLRSNSGFPSPPTARAWPIWSRVPWIVRKLLICDVLLVFFWRYQRIFFLRCGGWCASLLLFFVLLCCSLAKRSSKNSSFWRSTFSTLFFTLLSLKISLSLFLSVCAERIITRLVCLSIYLSIYLSLYSRGRVFDDDIFFNSANERSAHTHTGRRRRRRRFVRSLGTSSSRFRRLHADSLLSLLCVKKQKKSDESSNSNLSLSSFLSLPLFNLFRVWSRCALLSPIALARSVQKKHRRSAQSVDLFKKTPDRRRALLRGLDKKKNLPR